MEAVPEGGLSEAESESKSRVTQSLELLSHYSTENHPGHQPGRFVGPGSEYDGMTFDGQRWHLKHEETGEGSSSTALAKLCEADQALATRFEAEGGLALCLSNAFKAPERLRAQAQQLLELVDGSSGGTVDDISVEPLDDTTRRELELAGLGPAMDVLKETGPVEQALLLFKAADLLEEREAVMRNVWSDVEFHSGEAGNAELVSRLERQFASQLVRTAEVRMEAQEEANRSRGDSAPTSSSAPGESAEEEPVPEPQAKDGIFEIALRDCSEANALAQRLPVQELNATLLEPRNLGVALDLVGVYLKNYEIDKADLVITRIVPLCRQRGGVWLVKGLDKLSAVRMKQFKAYESLVALKEIEEIVPFTSQEGWEFYDILYRNLAWCYSALDEPERCLEYTRKSVEVKRASGVPATWFDIWDLAKGHARLGQKTRQRDEMTVAYQLCCKAGEIHRTAEPTDRIMLAKILSNVGEIAMGIGDDFHLAGDDASAMPWYKKAEPSLRESYELHATALGPMKPLTGWAAGTVAHCMVRLERWEDACSYLAQAFKVECTKDSTTPGSVIELLDRVLNAHQQVGDLKRMALFAGDIHQCLMGLRDRGWEERERDVFALLLYKVATAYLVGDDGSGNMIQRALTVLREAETDLKIHIGTLHGVGAHQCETCGKLFSEKSELEAHVKRRHSGTVSQDRMDVGPKKFGPQADNPEELLEQVRTSIKVLEMGQGQRSDERFTVIGGGGLPSRTPEPVVSPSTWGLGMETSGPEPEEVALARSYALVGNWNDWGALQELTRESDSSLFTARVVVPPGRDIEFQVICDRSWRLRLFPAGSGGGAILGPSSAGHGRNWKLLAPPEGSVLQVTFNPTGERYLNCSLVPWTP